MSELAIELKGIDKSFGPVHANRAIDLKVRKGTIHGIIGENGAGKSTLMSILYGFYQADKGEIHVGGRRIDIKDPSTAIASGIGMVHQHFMLVENFTVLENVMLGAEDSPILNKGIAKARAELKRLETEYEMEVDPDAVIQELPVGIQQRVEILKALFRGADILILDEPTGVLTPAEADHLFRILGQLKDQGKTVLLITHKLREIMAITDEVSVMRRGEMVATRETAKTSVEELAELMVGRRVLLQVEKGEANPGEVKLSVKGLTVRDSRGVTMVDDVSFDVRAGEIVGIAGVAGNGQSELLEAIAGMRRATAGTVLLDPIPFAGAFLGQALLLCMAFVILLFLRIPKQPSVSETGGGRPVLTIIRQPRFIISALCAITSYAIMSFVMTAAPLAMVACNYSPTDAAHGIQWHVMAMFGPSFFTGHLIARYGKETIVSAGLVLLFGCAVVALSGVDLAHFFVALILLGLGWNFGFIGATAMVTECYRPEERAKVQGVNDFLVFGFVSCASLMSGKFLAWFGWEAINWTVIPFVVLCFGMLVWLAIDRRRRSRRIA